MDSVVVVLGLDGGCVVVNGSITISRTWTDDLNDIETNIKDLRANAFQNAFSIPGGVNCNEKLFLKNMEEIGVVEYIESLKVNS